MRASALKYAVLSVLSIICMVVLALAPFHAFLTVWLSSLIDGHYIALRLWKETLLLVGIIVASYLVLADHKIRSHTLTRRLVWLILIYIALNGALGLIAYHQQEVTLKAATYGFVINTRFLFFFLVVWAVALRTSRLQKRWIPLVLYPAAVVCIFGVLQVFVLPKDFLSHFGYNLTTIDPYGTINNNQNYIRIISTLRGANPLGTYLLIPISVLIVLIIRGKRNWQNISLLIAALITLYFSFSRGAWLGMALSFAIILLLNLHSQKAKLTFAGIFCAAILLVASGAIILKDNTHFQNVFLHTQTNSASPISSNDNHIAALENGFENIKIEPLGGGTGSAGPASVYNERPIRIAENYYIQLGQEVGIVGVALFVLINLGVGYLLWLRRSDPLALSLLVSLIGISFINMLSHAWTDDTVAYLWWGLAGIAMVNVSLSAKKSETVKSTK